MSRFYQNKKFKLKRIRRIYDDMSPFERREYTRRLDKWWKAWVTPINYSAVPTEWNNLNHTRPNRRWTERNLTKVIHGYDADILSWPDYRKPLQYYY